jgi:uncharacterized membrane protein
MTIIGVLYVIAALFFGAGILLFVMGNRALNETTQSADVRAGGYIINVIAVVLCAIGIIIFLLLG